MTGIERRLSVLEVALESGNVGFPAILVKWPWEADPPGWNDKMAVTLHWPDELNHEGNEPCT